MPRKAIKLSKHSTPLFYPSLILLFIVLPVFYMQQTMDKVLMPRLLFLNAFLFVFYTLLLLGSKLLKTDFTILKNKIFILFFLMFLLTFSSQLWALNFKEGWFDTIKTFSTLALCFAFVQLFMNTENAHLKITQLLIVSAIINSGIGIFEYIQMVLPDPSLEIDKLGVIYQVQGIFGHKNQFAIALALQLPFLVFGVLRLKSLWRVGAVLALLMTGLMIVLLETRSVWVATMLSLPTVLIVGALNFRIPGINVSHPKKLVLPLSIFVAILAAGLFVASQYEPLSKKMASLTDPTNARNIHRVKVWDFTLKMAMEKPLTGVGAGNWKLEAPRFHRDAGFDISESNWVRPHNDFLWVLAEKGIIGFLLFTGIFILGFLQALRIIRSKLNPEKRLFVLFGFGGLMIYTLVSFFTFPLERINHQVYLALFLAIIMVHVQHQKPVKEIMINPLIIFIPIVLLAFFGMFYGYKMVSMETLLNKAKAAYENSRWNETIENAEKALSPLRDFDAENAPVEWYLGTALNAQGKYDQALSHMQKAYRISPNNPIVMNNLGQIYFHSGETEQAIIVLKKALNLYPRFMEANVNISSCYYDRGNYYEAYKALLSIRVKDRSATVNNNMKILSEKIGKKKSNKAKREVREALNMKKPAKKAKK